MDNRQRFVVLISGSGTNLQAILDACTRGDLSGQVVAVIANQADAYGLERARKAGVPVVVLEKASAQDRQGYDLTLAEIVAGYHPDWVVLAGWMRILTIAFLGRFPDRVINLHPALPGAFPGTHAIERAYQDWQEGKIDRSGVMVHLVPDEGVDVGPVLAQEEILFQAGETLQDFEQRVHALEHRLLVETLKNITGNAAML
ncbi:MAG: phosphoribosylglycinamide formyltransferase [Chloroflexota bacterium]